MTELPEGWLTDGEAADLQALARGKLVLEIGSYKGRSTIAMARVALHVVAVDWHRGSEEFASIGAQPSLAEFIANLDKHGVRDKVSVCVMDAARLERLFRPATFDLVFVDGAHDFGSVMRDCETALKLVRTAGHVVCHDYANPWFQVIHAVNAVKERHILGGFEQRGALAILKA